MDNRVEVVQKVQEINDRSAHALYKCIVIFDGRICSTLTLETTLPMSLMYDTEKTKKMLFEKHDERFYKFMKEFGLPITGIEVVDKK